jgi:3-amino-5-hydroxybenzoic acid synthesis related protein
MDMFNIDAIVFDLDGVLIDSRPQMEFVFRECYRQFVDEGEPPLQEFFHRMGMPLPDILRALGLPAEMLQTYRKLSRQLYKQIRVVPGAYSTLELIRSMGMPIGLMTGKDRERTLEILGHCGLKQFFSATVCGDDAYPGKPAPDGLLALAARFGVSPERTVIVGDSVLDIQCGLAAGAQALAATWGFESKERMAGCGAHQCLASFEELDTWLLSLPVQLQPEPLMYSQTGVAES